MSILACPQCDVKIRIPAEAQGKRGDCPRCATSLLLMADPTQQKRVFQRYAPKKPSLASKAKPKPKATVAASELAKTKPLAKEPTPTASKPKKPKKKKRSGMGLFIGVVTVLLLAGGGVWGYLWYVESSSPSFRPPAGGYAANYPINFLDEVESQPLPEANFHSEILRGTDGKVVDLKQYQGKKNVVIVVMRGFDGSVCVGCRAQTSRLIKNHAEFAKRNAEVLVVYPGTKEHVAEFIRLSKQDADEITPQFPIVIDEEFHLVDRFDIRGNKAKPSTFILDKKGEIRFAYIGQGQTDRPSITALLTQLDKLEKN
jgi:peroxiredoxin